MWVIDYDYILRRLDEQAQKLGLSRSDLARRCEINTTTYINNFTRHKIPKFNDLFHLTQVLGISFDSLFCEENIRINPEDNPDDIVYWVGLIEHGVKPSSILLRTNETYRFCALLQNLSKGIDVHHVMEGGYLSLEEVRLYVVLVFLSLEEADSMDAFRIGCRYLLEYFDFELTPPLDPTSFPCLQDRYRKLTVILPKGVMHYPASNLWAVFDDVVEKSFGKFRFLQESGLSGVTYSRYQLAKDLNSSPTTETVIRACNTLEIPSIQKATQEMDESFSTFPFVADSASLVKLKKPWRPYFNYSFSEICPFPYLISFFDYIFNMPEDALFAFANDLYPYIKAPYSSYAWEKTWKK